MVVRVGTHFLPLTSIAAVQDHGACGSILLTPEARDAMRVDHLGVPAHEWDAVRRQLLEFSAAAPDRPARRLTEVRRAVG